MSAGPRASKLHALQAAAAGRDGLAIVQRVLAAPGAGALFAELFGEDG